MAITYNNLYLDIRQRLRAAGIESATLEARELVCFGTGKSREELARSISSLLIPYPSFILSGISTSAKALAFFKP